MSWTCYFDNDTGECLTCAGYWLTHGTWKKAPPASIDPDKAITFECDSEFGRLAGWASYLGARGGVTVTWDVPLLFGDPTNAATCSGVYTSRRMGSSEQEAGGVMFRIAAPPPSAVTRTVCVAPTSPTNPTPTGATVVPKGDGKKYTTNPNEVTTVRTTPTIGEVVGVLKSGWPDLTELGARTLASQWAAETAFGRYCFNFNLGNVKAKSDEQHMYLHGVWELLDPSAADSAVAAAAGLAHIASDAEIKEHKWVVGATQRIVVFEPPHVASRFRAYDSLADGCAKYVARHIGYSKKQAGYLDAINAGDTDQVAHILKVLKYYTATEASYKAGMKRCKATIDAKLGALPDASSQPSSSGPPPASALPPP
jgi:hypothetical protein